MDSPLPKSALKKSHIEFRMMPFMYFSYTVCVILIMMVFPLEDSLRMQIFILLTAAQTCALAGLSARALQRIEERLDQL